MSLRDEAFLAKRAPSRRSSLAARLRRMVAALAAVGVGLVMLSTNLVSATPVAAHPAPPFASSSPAAVGSPTISPIARLPSMVGGPALPSAADRPAAPPPTYTVSFQAMGLPIATVWTLNFSYTYASNWTVINTSSQHGPSTFLNFTAPNGTYVWTTNTTANYSGAPLSGRITILGHPHATVVTYFPNYFVKVDQAGLPASERWSIVVTNATNNSYTWTLSGVVPNFTLRLLKGRYDYTISGPTNWSAFPRSLNFLLGSSGFELAIRWSPVVFLVDFYETGLPYQTSWAVQVRNLSGVVGGLSYLSGTGNTLPVALQNGSYNFTVRGLANYTPTPRLRDLTVGGVAQNITINWAQNLFNVPFAEVGLPAGTLWGVSVGTAGSVQFYEGHSNASSLNVRAPNGTNYPYEVAPVKGYTASPGSGRVNVDGGAPVLTITFTAIPSTGSHNNQSSPGASAYLPEIALVIVAVVVVLGLGVWMMRRRGQGPAPLSSDAGSDGSEEPAAEPGPPPP